MAKEYFEENEIAIGNQFPEQRELDRIKIQSKWEEMFNGTWIYNKIVDNTGQRQDVDPIVPIPAVISEISGDLLYGEFPNFIFESDADQTAFDEYVEQNPEFKTDLLENATLTSAVSTMFVYQFIMDGRYFSKFIHPRNIIWNKDILGITKAQIFKEIERPENEKWVKYQVIELDYVYNDQEFKSPLSDEDRKYRTKTMEIIVEQPQGERKIKDIKIIDEQVTEWDFIPLVQFDNLRVLGNKIGKSDYQGKEQLFAEIDNRVDQINYVLQEHADPWEFIPSGVLDENGKFNRANGKMVEKGIGNTGDNTVDIVSWDANLTSAFEQIKLMIQLVLFTSRISNSIAGFFFDRSGGQQESGRAIKQKSVNTNSMIERKRKYQEEGIRNLLRNRAIMDDDFKLSEDFNLTVKWQDGLPLDKTEIVEAVVKEINAGLKSHLTAIKEINEVDDAQAEKEMNQITTEKEAQATIESQKFKIEV